mmetsp:Transcript_10571/g.20358  ORF Transcript_10571/g.20358 Transcript_10571/m.20358 type:complete len:183 (+) Transcript_10571:275-823(+)
MKTSLEGRQLTPSFSVKRISISLGKPLSGLDLLKLMNPLMRPELELDEMRFLLSRIPDTYKDAVERIFRNYVFTSMNFSMPSDLFITTYDSNFDTKGPSVKAKSKSPMRDSISIKEVPTRDRESFDKSPDRTYSEIYTKKHSVHRQIQENDIKLLQHIHSKQRKLKVRTPSRSDMRSVCKTK